MIASRPTAGFLGLDRAIPRMVAEGDFPDRGASLRAIAEYERFFLLAAGHRDGPLVPSWPVDLVWRRHMLDTPAYAEDCARWAGGYLHRVDGTTAGEFGRTLALLGGTDATTWGRPGPAHLTPEAGPAEGPEGRLVPLDGEDLSGVLERVRSWLGRTPSAARWVAGGRALLESDPDLAVREYRRFLGLLIGARRRVTPSRLVDEFWHQHILDSRAYAHFCERVAGRYLHHFPNYARASAAHLPTFRRTLALYRGRVGAEPPAEVWAHQGESEGGGGGCSSCSSAPRTPPTPLYAVDNPWHMRAHLTLGRVDRRHRSSLHPVLVKKEIAPALWGDLVRAVEKAPRVGWSEFTALPGNSPRLWAAIPPVTAGLIAAFEFAATGAKAGEVGVGAGLAAIAASLVALFGFAGRWGRRPFDGPGVDAIVAHFEPEFSKHGVALEFLPEARAVQVDAYFTEAQMLSWEVADRMRREREAEERRWEAEEARAALEGARRAREKQRRLRQAERDAYYLDRGIKPGPMAWYAALPDWCRAILVGVILALPAVALLLLLLASPARQ